MGPEVHRDSDAAVIPGGLTPLIQTLFGKILRTPTLPSPSPIHSRNIVIEATATNADFTGEVLVCEAGGSVGILQKLNCFSCPLIWGGGGGAPQTSVDKVNWQF